MAREGDTVVVLEGRYTGPGNRDLNFRGKAIIVRSRDPEDNECLGSTIIDAQGKGVIVRFINDEGPQSVFTGFSLQAGDITASVRGLPGFFEFSDKARPTTSRISIEGEISTVTDVTPAAIGQEPPFGGRVWDGNDPFHQPFPTTDYYGSGDVDNDGSISANDSSMANEMANGSMTPSYRADVDGNGTVNDIDVTLIQNSIMGSILPGWWDHVTERDQRNLWLTKILAIDQTNQHPWLEGWFVCLQFSAQTFLHAAYHRADLFQTEYDGGSTFFNLPLYVVNVAPGHAINAILVGNDPLNFEDWRFIEPQTDEDVEPGAWDMPFPNNVSISVPKYMGANDVIHLEKVEFYIDEEGWNLVEYSPDLLLTRQGTNNKTPDNRPDLWNSRVIPINEGMLLYEQSRDDLSHMTDIHLADLPLDGIPEGVPITNSSQYSRLLDFTLAPDGTIHLLWKGKPDYLPGLFHGILNPFTRELTEVTRISPWNRSVRQGRVVVTPEREIYVFWYETRNSMYQPFDTGIFWTRWNNSGWQEPVNLTPGAGAIMGVDPSEDWEEPSNLHYIFDVAVSREGTIDLVWAEPREWYEDATATVRHMRYNGSWGNPIFIEQTFDYNSYPLGVDLTYDAKGFLHLAYWFGTGFHPWGNTVHRLSDGTSWSVGETLDQSGSSGFPRFALGPGSTIFLVWSRKENEHIFPVWNSFSSGNWQGENTVSIDSNSDAFYPQAEYLANNDLVIYWSSRSSDLVTIGVEKVSIPEFGQITIDIKPNMEPNSINCKNSQAVIPVAVITDDTFDALTVDHSTVTFEGASEIHTDKRTGTPKRHEEDVDGDGDMDLVFHFRLGDTTLTCNSVEGTLKGQTFGGVLIEGTDSIRMVNK